MSNKMIDRGAWQPEFITCGNEIIVTLTLYEKTYGRTTPEKIDIGLRQRSEPPYGNDAHFFGRPSGVFLVRPPQVRNKLVVHVDASSRRILVRRVSDPAAGLSSIFSDQRRAPV